MQTRINILIALAVVLIIQLGMVISALPKLDNIQANTGLTAERLTDVANILSDQ